MHLADHLAHRLDLPAGYRARPYHGAGDHRAMAPILNAYRTHHGDPQMVTSEEMDVTYAHLEDCDPERDIVLIEHGSEETTPVAYARASYEDLDSGLRDCIVFAPTDPDHLSEPLFRAVASGMETHMRPWAEAVTQARYRAYSSHPGPEHPPAGEAAWLERLGYETTEWSAFLVRPHLDDIPRRELPVGVEVRPVTEDQIRPILEAHFEAFRGEWDSRDPTEADFAEIIESPTRDETLWKVAWVGDTVVGQVKSYVNHHENAATGRLRGYTEDIATHRDWRNRGIAGALLAMSLQELKDRGLTEAALGADTNNPGGAFHLYTSLGFEPQGFEAVYTRPIATS